MDVSELDRDLNCTPVGDKGELDRPVAKMTLYAPVCGSSGKVRYVSISLPYVESIAAGPTTCRSRKRIKTEGWSSGSRFSR